VHVNAAYQAEHRERQKKQGSAHGMVFLVWFLAPWSAAPTGSETCAGSWRRPVRFVAGSGRRITSRCATVADRPRGCGTGEEHRAGAGLRLGENRRAAKIAQCQCGNAATSFGYLVG
jgi:hypothetical protein